MNTIQKSLLTGVILLIVLFILDGVYSIPERHNGVIVDKQYKPESNSTGTGIGTTSNGSTTIVTTSEHESEQFIIILKTNSGVIITAESKSELYYSKSIGEKVKYDVYKGYFTGVIWGRLAVE